MTVYAQYAYYKSNGSGRVPKERYNYLARLATQQIDYLTHGRVRQLDDVPENVKMCQCELADALYSRSVSLGEVDGVNAPARSESVGSYSVTYASADSTAEVNSAGQVDAVVRGICAKWLSQPINFMYAGVS